jgi:hypothetical protein
MASTSAAETDLDSKKLVVGAKASEVKKTACNIPFTPMPLEMWMHDDSTSSCFVCNQAFNPFKRRVSKPSFYSFG